MPKVTQKTSVGTNFVYSEQADMASLSSTKLAITQATERASLLKLPSELFDCIFTHLILQDLEALKDVCPRLESEAKGYLFRNPGIARPRYRQTVIAVGTNIDSTFTCYECRKTLTADNLEAGKLEAEMEKWGPTADLRGICLKCKTKNRYFNPGTKFIGGQKQLVYCGRCCVLKISDAKLVNGMA